MIDDFRVVIGIAWRVKQEMMVLDHKKLWPYHLPEVAATEAQVVESERTLGHPLDPRYRAFLKRANGWPAFYQTVDLFGTIDLIGGPRRENANAALRLLDNGVLATSGVNIEELLPIAATKLDRDLFVMTRPHARCPGMVIWFAGEEVDRFSIFDDCFLAMIEYNRQELNDFKADGIGGKEKFT
jgi:SMI1-KNR4 cell-wall